MNFEIIGAKELDEYRRIKNQVLLIDLREEEEFRQEHIQDAINIPYDELEEKLDMLPKNQEIVLYCERGGLSFIAAKQLSEKGFRIKTLIGGIHAYNAENLE